MRGSSYFKRAGSRPGIRNRVPKINNLIFFDASYSSRETTQYTQITTINLTCIYLFIERGINFSYNIMGIILR